MALCLCGQMQVNAETMDDGTDDLVLSGINEDMLRQIEPTKLLQKSEMRKDIVIELSYRGFSCTSDYS